MTQSSTDRKTLIRRNLYLCLLTIWLVYGAIFPTWTGRFYNPDTPDNPTRWYDGGTFELKEGDGDSVRTKSPIWNPPVPYAEGMKAPVRWPWQPVEQRANIELDLGALAFRWSFGVIGLGIAFTVWNWIRRTRHPDLILTIAWAAALWQVIAWLGIAVLIAVTAGFGAGTEVILGTLAGAGVAGVVHGVFMWRKRSRLAASGAASGAGNEGTNASAASIGLGLMWFVLGMIAGIGLAIVALQIAANFRGPVIGVWELGTPRYANDQKPVDVWTGVALTAAGWTIGSILKSRWRSMRAFAWGLIVAATALGILSALRK
ncbi:MAG: hypothetical protein K8R92_11990 [Planctomycetes bacterium]|nr:hypothetical protein [Planctomycetota bacterium]